MNINKLPILYIKSGCPWCREALSFFNGQGVQLEVRDVIANPKDMDAMLALSGQTKRRLLNTEISWWPTLTWTSFWPSLTSFPKSVRSWEFAKTKIRY